MIFVDTGAWFACFVSHDHHHEQAAAWYLNNTQTLVTSDHVLAELFTLLKARGEFQTALAVGDDLWAGKLAYVEGVTAGDLAQAWHTYKTYHDKRWSFTDCTSRVVMERLGVKQAFSFDEHFRQFGTVAVVP